MSLAVRTIVEAVWPIIAVAIRTAGDKTRNEHGSGGLTT
jgi:hypothetical protein